MKYLYKYPQGEYPYNDLVQTNRNRSREEMEYELLDTGIFDQDKYFDVFVEYAKADPEDVTRAGKWWSSNARILRRNASGACTSRNRNDLKVQDWAPEDIEKIN